MKENVSGCFFLNTVYLYSAHRAVIFAIAQLSCYYYYYTYYVIGSTVSCDALQVDDKYLTEII